jgi:hypothetical protein
LEGVPVAIPTIDFHSNSGGFFLLGSQKNELQLPGKNNFSPCLGTALVLGKEKSAWKGQLEELSFSKSL